MVFAHPLIFSVLPYHTVTFEDFGVSQLVECRLVAGYFGGLVLVSESLLVVGTIVFWGGAQAIFVKHKFVVIHIIASP